MARERVIENLNRALCSLLEKNDDVLLIGEDLLDPYGGAFKASKGLSTRFPDRVLTTPLSEQAIVGVAAGMALNGEKPIAEIMFGDFTLLAFDQLANFAAKSVTMYGQQLPMRMIVRCAMGGERGYGPTHSQTLQKHFIGVPNLHIFEMSPFHDNLSSFVTMFDAGVPCLFAENKVLYTRKMFADGGIDDLFQYEQLGGRSSLVRVYSESFDDGGLLVVAGGGVSNRCLGAMRELFLEYEIETQLIVPARIYPIDWSPFEKQLHKFRRIFIVEESTAGGTWGAEISQSLYERCWSSLAGPIRLIHSRDSIIPSARHLEAEMIVSMEDIVQTVSQEVLGASDHHS